MERSPRISVTVTRPQQEWLTWYAAQTGRTPAAAAARLLERAIEEERAKPALAAAFDIDAATPAASAPVLADITAALGVPGVHKIVNGDDHEATPAALRAAGYLQNVSRWLARSVQGAQVGPPPRLAHQEPAAAPGLPITEAMGAWRKAGSPPYAMRTSGGAPMASDKRTLSDIGGR